MVDYAIVKTGGKQYRVSPGDVLAVARDGQMRSSADQAWLGRE